MMGWNWLVEATILRWQKQTSDAVKKKQLAKFGLQFFAISNHMVGQALCDRIDERHRALRKTINSRANPPNIKGFTLDILFSLRFYLSDAHCYFRDEPLKEDYSVS
jgi:hypothetical protein